MSRTRERIIETAAVAFMRQGFAGSGLKQISTESSAQFGSLYHFFPGGKVELAAETLRWAGARYQELVAAVMDAAPDIVAGISNAFDAAAETLEATDYADACPIATVALEVASTNDTLRRVTNDIFESWLNAATDRFVAAGIDLGRARELAVLVVAALEGGFLLSRAAKNPDAMRVMGASVAAAVRDALPSEGSEFRHRDRARSLKPVANR